MALGGSLGWGKSDILNGKKRKGLPAAELNCVRLGNLALVDVGTLAAIGWAVQHQV